MKLNLVVIRSDDIDRSAEFYQQIGLSFCKHSHGKGPLHYSSDREDLVFEIYPKGKSGKTTATRLGFRVNDLDDVLKSLQGIGANVMQAPKESEWGSRAVVKDFDGHQVELIQ